jgi:hypothetical protein
MVGCPSQEQLAAILASVMVTGVSRPRGLSRGLSLSPEGEGGAGGEGGKPEGATPPRLERTRSVKFREEVGEAGPVEEVEAVKGQAVEGEAVEGEAVEGTLNGSYTESGSSNGVV